MGEGTVRKCGQGARGRRLAAPGGKGSSPPSTLSGTTIVLTGAGLGNGSLRIRWLAIFFLATPSRGRSLILMAVSRKTVGWRPCVEGVRPGLDALSCAHAGPCSSRLRRPGHTTARLREYQSLNRGWWPGPNRC